MGKQDYYATLGVARDADAEDLKRAYRKLAMERHPDRNGGTDQAKASFQELNEAYDVLKDDQKRGAYDRYGHAAFETGGPQSRGPSRSREPSTAEVWDNFFDGLFTGMKREFAARKPEPEKPKTDIEKFNDLIKGFRQPFADKADLSRQAQNMLRPNSALAAAVAGDVLGLVERQGDEAPVQKLFEHLLDSNPNSVGAEQLSRLVRGIPAYHSKGDRYDKTAFCHAWAAETIIAKDAKLATAQTRNGNTIDALVLEATQNRVDNPAVRKLFETTFLKAAPQAITDRWLYNWTRGLFYSHVFRGAADLPPEHNRAWIFGITRQALEKNPGLATIRVNSEAGASHTTVASYVIEAAKRFGDEPAVQELFNVLPNNARPGMVGRWRLGLPIRYGKT